MKKFYFSDARTHDEKVQELLNLFSDNSFTYMFLNGYKLHRQNACHDNTYLFQYDFINCLHCTPQIFDRPIITFYWIEWVWMALLISGRSQVNSICRNTIIPDTSIYWIIYFRKKPSSSINCLNFNRHRKSINRHSGSEISSPHYHKKVS